MYKLLPLFALTLLLAACGEKDPCDCEEVQCLTYTESHTLTGTVRVGSYDLGIPSLQEPYKPYLLDLPQDICVLGTTAFGENIAETQTVGPLRTLQLGGEFTAEQALEAMGRQAIVSGQLYPGVTQWHVTPVLMSVKNLASKPKPASTR